MIEKQATEAATANKLLREENERLESEQKQQLMRFGIAKQMLDKTAEKVAKLETQLKQEKSESETAVYLMK